MLAIWLIVLPVVSPSPSCPQSFPPQPNTPPETERAKLCSPSAAIWTRGIADRDRRCWGELVLSFLSPRPSWPLESWPHVYTWPSVEKSPWLPTSLPADLHFSPYSTLSHQLPSSLNKSAFFAPGQLSYTATIWKVSKIFAELHWTTEVVVGECWFLFISCNSDVWDYLKHFP